MSVKVMPIDFESETFGYILEDMTSDMNTLLRNMDDMGASDGKFTLTINVHLEEKECEDGEERIMPVIKHKIKSGFQVQHESDGQLDGEYCLDKNEDGNFQLTLLHEQMSIFDEDEDEPDEEETLEAEEEEME